MNRRNIGNSGDSSKIMDTRNRIDATNTEESPVTAGMAEYCG